MRRESPRRRGLTRLAAVTLAVAAALYLSLAYLAVPEFWTLREKRLRPPSRMVTTTPQGIPGDPINVGFVGSHQDVTIAFAAAGWGPADLLTLRTAVEIGLSVVLDRPYPDAPVSTLLYEGRRQDLAFEKPVGTSADRRHHLRLWHTGERLADGRPLWLGAASYDRGSGFSHDTGQFTHHIGPDIDAERALVFRDLENAGRIISSEIVAGLGATANGRNGGGDLYFTDGKARIGILRAGP